MKPALIYYGGKQTYIKDILDLVPTHDCYCEPFAGGATVLFAKKKSSVEIINDNLDCLVNFYRVLQHPEKQRLLFQMCKETLYSRTAHYRAVELLKTGNEIERAWALWFKINTGFSGKLDGSFSTTKKANNSPTVKFQNYKDNLYMCAERIEKVQIENLDALKCIDIYDSPDTFFFIDPPYLEADQGHYKGYLPENFEQLLFALQRIEGKFLLTCYPGEIVDAFINKNNWSWLEIKRKIRARNSNRHGQKKQPVKTELLVWSGYACNKQMGLFE